MNEADLMAAISQQPGEDEPRLVLADWFEERGDPRGEFIRVGCEIARLDPRDQRLIDLEYRHRRLLLQHRKKWVKFVPKFPHKAEFHRGFVHRMTLPAKVFIDSAEQLFRETPLEEVRLSQVKPHVEELARCKHLRRLKHLDLRDAKLGLGRLKKLLASEYLDQLEGIDLSFNGLKVSAIREVCACETLHGIQRLILHSCGIDEQAMRLILESPISHGLQQLKIGYNELHPEVLHLLAAAEQMKTLRSFDFSHNSDVGGEGIRAIMQSEHFVNLDHLSLRACTRWGGGLEALAETDRTHRLVSLDLQGNSRDAEQTAAIADANCLSRLVSLDLTDCELGTAGLRGLIERAGMQDLRFLGLEGTRIDADAVRLLADWPAVENLTRLDLKDNDLGEDGVKMLLGSKAFSNLTELHVSQNTDEMARFFLDAPHLTRLTSLTVGTKYRIDPSTSIHTPLIQEETKKLLLKRYGKSVIRI